MRKMLLHILLFSAAFAGCGKDVVEIPGDYIDFTVDAEDTKASLVSGTLPSGTRYGVFGFLFPRNIATDALETAHGGVSWAEKRANSKPDIFFNAAVNYSGGVSTFNSAGDKKEWTAVLTDKYTFFAYWPHTSTNSNVSVISTSSTKDAPTMSYSMPSSYYGNASITDLSGMVDFMTAQAVDRTSPMGSVPLNFNHRLFAVDFAVNNFNPENDNGDNDIKITRVAFSGTFNKTISCSLGDLPSAGLDNYTSGGTYTATFVIYNGAAMTVEPNTLTGKTPIPLDAEARAASHLILVPQETGAGTWSVSVTYSKGDGSSTTDTISPNAGIFYPGTKYTVCLNFLGDAVSIDIQASVAWDDPGGDINMEFD